MIRRPLACAALCAIAGHAAAQSTVTVYGVIDNNLTYGKGSIRSEKAVGTGGLAGSRLGFRGTEDLGGGLRANFVIEHGLNSDTGVAAGGATFWNRQSYLGLAGGFGELQLGRMYTPTFMVHATYDAFGPQGVAAQQVLLGSMQITQPANIRANDAINYNTPAPLGGFVGQAMVSEDPNGYKGVRVGWRGGAFAGDIAFGRYDNAAIGDLKTITAGARYTIGAFTLYGLVDRSNSGSSTDSRGAQVSAMYLLGATELKASIAQSSRKSAAGANVGTTRRYGIGAVHNLSKRTALYTSIAHVTNSHGAATALNGSATAPNKGSSGIDMGIRHAF
jgi:predicted porin